MKNTRTSLGLLIAGVSLSSTAIADPSSSVSGGGGIAGALTSMPTPTPVPTLSPQVPTAPKLTQDVAAPIECRMQEPSIKRITNFKEAPSFFVKVSADGRYMGYIANSRNYVMDLENPDTRVIIPGPYDPVAVPPNPATGKVEHITAPNGGMNFFDMAQVTGQMQPGKTVDLSTTLQPAYKDSGNQNNYQSVGVLPGSSAKPTYRMVSGSLTIDEYDTSTQPWTKKRRIDKLCGAPAGTYKLPMISKNGLEVSVFDTNSGTTKIFGIKEDGSCETKLDVGYPTGKVEFAYDGSAITFHVDSYGRNDGAFSGIDSKMTKNVYVLKLERDGEKLKAGELRRITSNSNPGEGSYYPAFTVGGDITYVHGQKDAANKVHFSFRTVDPKTYPAFDSPTSSSCKPEVAAKFALGDLWAKICSKFSEQLTSTDKALWSLSLDPKECRQLVRKNWERMRQDIVSNDKLTRSGHIERSDLEALTPDAVEAACPSAAPEKQETQVLSPNPQNTLTPVAARPMSAPQVFDSYCRSCHIGVQAPKLVWDQMSLDDINNSLIAITSGDMPRERMENRDRTLRPLVEELLRRRSEMEANAHDE